LNYHKSPKNFAILLHFIIRKSSKHFNIFKERHKIVNLKRSGSLPDIRTVGWRGDSGLTDGCDVGEDLTGGWYDAGDHVKFGLPMAWSTTTLVWGMIDFKKSYQSAWAYKKGLEQVKWTLDYFVKCHTDKFTFYVQVGDGNADHAFWGRAEDMTMQRKS
jgi:endoglucanase